MFVSFSYSDFSAIAYNIVYDFIIGQDPQNRGTHTRQRRRTDLVILNKVSGSLFLTIVICSHVPILSTIDLINERFLFDMVNCSTYNLYTQ